jgi:hypothetical protein
MNEVMIDRIKKEIGKQFTFEKKSDRVLVNSDGNSILIMIKRRITENKNPVTNVNISMTWKVGIIKFFDNRFGISIDINDVCLFAVPDDGASDLIILIRKYVVKV